MNAAYPSRVRRDEAAASLRTELEEIVVRSTRGRAHLSRVCAAVWQRADVAARRCGSLTCAAFMGKSVVLAARRSASAGVAGKDGVWLRTMPSGDFVSARIALTASPWDSIRWWATCRLSARLLWPGANWAVS